MEWRTIESAPRNGTPVIIFATDHSYFEKPSEIVGEAYCHEESGKWWWANTSPGDYYADEIDYRITHWMPLPEPPK